MNEKDIRIVQDPRILQQILKTIPEGVHNQINVIMVNQVNNGHEDFDFLEFLKSLPEPRMKSLKTRAVQASFKWFKKSKEVANFLGLSERGLFPSSFHKDLAKIEDEPD